MGKAIHRGFLPVVPSPFFFSIQIFSYAHDRANQKHILHLIPEKDVEESALSSTIIVVDLTTCMKKNYETTPNRGKA